MGIVQFTNYLRLVVFLGHVSMLNERLKLLDEKIVKIKSQSQQHDGKLHFDYIATSTLTYDTMEVYRKTFGEIWKLHQLMCRSFGFSLLAITLNALTSAAISLYFSILSHSKNVTIDFVAEPSLHTFHIGILFVILVNTCETSNELVSMNEYISNLNPFQDFKTFQLQDIHRHLNQMSRNFYYLQVKEFSLQIVYHQKFLYTAHHYFDLNFRFLYSVTNYER